MRSVCWALLVLLGSFLLQPALAGPHAHNQAVKDRRWKDQLKGIRDYEIVVPRCLDRWGRHYPAEQHFLRRHRRSISRDLSRDQSEESGDGQPVPSARARGTKYYDFNAYGRRFSLELTPNEDFLSSAVLVQIIDGNYSLTKNLSHIVDANCFHSGTVNGDPDSAAHLSVCSGLRGSIRAYGEVYFIESHPDPAAVPDLDAGSGHGQDSHVRDADDGSDFTERRRAHIIYKMSDLDHFTEKTSHCHSKNHHKHMRWKYEQQVSRLFNHTVTFSSSRHSNKTSTSVTNEPLPDISADRSPSSPSLSSNASSKDLPRVPRLLKFDSLASLMAYLKMKSSSSPASSANHHSPWSPLPISRAALPSPPSPPSSSSSSSLSLSDPKRHSSPKSSSMPDPKHHSASPPSPSSSSRRRAARRQGRGRRSLHHRIGEYTENMIRRYVELLIVADRAMYEYYRDDLEHYVLTLMAVVASIYHDPTIGQPIDIVLVKLVILRDNDKHGNLSISSNAIQTLKSFCAWQHRINAPESRPGHHDTAVLLTRENLCRSATKCDTLGLAELGTMCTPHKSCSIIEDNGLSSAFTVAHELGHVFSLPHDEHEACDRYHKPNEKHQMKAMAGTLDHTMQPWSWSDCSRGYMAEFIEYVTTRPLASAQTRHVCL